MAAPASEDRMLRERAAAEAYERIEAVNRGSLIIPYPYRGKRIHVMVSRQEFTDALTLAVFSGEIAPEEVPGIVRAASANTHRELARLHEALDRFQRPEQDGRGRALSGYPAGMPPPGYGGDRSAGYPGRDAPIADQAGRHRRAREAPPRGAREPIARQRQRRERDRSERHRPPT
ncbi:MAG TPA: hypothetical protein VGW34_13620 [Allosphingosinicella sp.]|nr:hypothetical protein [Allosphingosinicella sp.]